jgi:hypothetical protein
MATCSVVCPHCGAPQDEKSRSESAKKNRDALIVIVPTILGGVAGLLVSGNAWVIVGGGAVGLVIGIGIIAAMYVWGNKR